MKKIKANRKIIIGLLIGIIISGVTSYAVAATLINSQDVVYDDKTSGLGANNVQNAIDKTCSNIDTRLSGIEDNLYTVKSFGSSATFPSKTTLFYTGVSLTFPANSHCSLTAIAAYWYNPPTAFYLCNSSTQCGGANLLMEGDRGYTGAASAISLNYNFSTTAAVTYYFWATYSGTGTNTIYYSGFCATKVKQ